MAYFDKYKYRAAEGLNEREEKLADIQDAAHERYMQRHRQSVESNPASYSSYDPMRRAVEADMAAKGLRQHELDRLRMQNENALDIERARAKGLENQGLAAARERAAADIDVAGKNLEGIQATQSGLTEREKAQIEANQKLEETRGANQLGLAAKQGEWSVKTEQERAKAAQEAAERAENQRRQRELELQRMKNEGAVDAATVKAQGVEKNAQANNNNAIITAAIKAGANVGKSPTQVLAELQQQYKDNPDLLAAITVYGAGAEARQPENRGWRTRYGAAQ